MLRPSRHRTARSVLCALCLLSALVMTDERAAAQVSDTTAPLSLFPPGTSVALDPNGFLQNPVWNGRGASLPDIERRCRFRVGTGHLEERTLITTKGPCLSEAERALVTLNEAPSILGLGLVCKTNSQIGTVRGHINWFPVTATGLLHGLGYSKGPGKDNDVTIDFLVAKGAALTTGNERREHLEHLGYHIEFYARETVARLPQRSRRSSWWHALRVSLLDSKLRNSVANRRLAIVTGLFGLDGVHEFQSELHPVFAMSVLVDTLRLGGGRIQERWAVMVQNLGNEGDCANGRFPLYSAPKGQRDQHFVIDFGWLPGASGASVRLGPSWSSDPGRRPTVREVPGSHLFVDFAHPRPRPTDEDYLFFGTVVIEWTDRGTGRWEDRFDGWYPDDLSFKVGPVLQYPEVDAEGMAELRGELLSYLPGRQAMEQAMEAVQARQPDGLPEVAEGPLDPIDPHWTPATRVRAEAPVPWSYRPVLDACGPGHPGGDPLCKGGLRWAIAPSVTFAPRGAPTPFVYLFVASHGWRGLGRIGEFLQIFAWRLDVRWDELIVRSPGPDEDPDPAGLGLRLGPSLQADNFRFFDDLVVAPYVAPRLTAFFEGDRVRMGYGAAVGLHWQVKYQEFFIEYQWATHSGAKHQHSAAVGIILA